MTTTHEATGSALIVSLGSWLLAMVNPSPSISNIAGIMSILASATLIYTHLVNAKGSPQVRDFLERALQKSLPFLKALAAAFVGGAADALYLTLSDPADFNWSAGKLWHSALCAGALFASGYILRSPFVRKAIDDQNSGSAAPPIDTNPKA